ncbi:MAG: hypothetical protein JSR81_14640 [Proteobacteria bacterium]|nr:hypothetical protein [Pseudomonadota bacterium]
MEIIIQERTYYSPGDENAFFGWLENLKCVSTVKGAPDGLHVKLRRRPSESDLREMIGLLYRYGLDMKPLAALVTERNARWFRNTKMFWYRSVFGKTSSKRGQKST